MTLLTSMLTNEGGGGNVEPSVVNFSNQDSVTVTHNLGYKPQVDVLDSEGFEVEFEEQHTSSNQFVVRFISALSGQIKYK